MTIFACLIVLAFWIGFWFWFLTRKDSSLTRKRLSPPVRKGRGLFIRKVKPDENQDLADWAQ